MNWQHLIKQLPYSKPFLFVDKLIHVSEEGVEGEYTFPEDSFFYQGHFKNYPVTPGVILTECCAQIGVVSLGLFLLGKEQELESKSSFKIGMSSSEMEFLTPVLPGEKVKVVSRKRYFRFHKLKCEVKMYNSDNQIVCRGQIAGMLKVDSNG
ncbi:3-hydroxyacyl-ACP dehydratase FabZ family protein [Cytophaga sp. FL35]|uniref:3-hydroxyacyl-ACP dehydratase FabZ family protein n=1 Tax=Cytophaga sp. FL35 TaxID=1904456 RepID=UPI001653BEB1|nr:3-hydroxyacyl-ACP dehydratase FabZ family protein [Cytophaga sp. FL35]MBC6998367.1 beta-hydroxyacyl-ACP dehydratase [Cytophaga sp. FL35]